jgi:hypothetical protein
MARPAGHLAVHGREEGPRHPHPRDRQGRLQRDDRAGIDRLFEEDDFTGLFDNVNEFKAAVRAVVKDEVDKAVQGELKDFFVLLARGGDPVPGPDDQHFKDSHRGLDTRLDDIYRLLARGELDGEINPTGTHFRDSNRTWPSSWRRSPPGCPNRPRAPRTEGARLRSLS